MKSKVLWFGMLLVATAVLYTSPVYAEDIKGEIKEETAENTALLQNENAEASEQEALSEEASVKETETDKKESAPEENINILGGILVKENEEKVIAQTKLTEKACVEKQEEADSTKDKKESATAKTSASDKNEANEKNSSDKTSASKSASGNNKSKTTKSDQTKSSKKTDTKKTTVKKNYTDEDVKLLACLVYAEAGNQPYKGKLAVANVVLNRVKSPLFPNKMKDVIYQNGYSYTYGRTIYQFSVAYPHVGTLKKALDSYGKRTNKIEKKAEEECVKAAIAALEGESAFDGANYLFFCRYSSSLANRKPNGVKIEAHYFYR